MSWFLFAFLFLFLLNIHQGSGQKQKNYNQQWNNYRKGSEEGKPTPTPNTDCFSKDCKCFHGPAGAPGMSGFPGMHGQRGPVGPKGDTGEMGTAGTDGTSGLTGESGARGKRGHQGEPGSSGTLGTAGEPGLRGVDGANGPKGDKGNAGNIEDGAKVAFSVVRSKKLGPVAENTAVMFDRIITNVGHGFDPQTSKFICRKKGVYAFVTHILSLDRQNAFAWVMKNKEHKVPLHGDGRAGYGTGSNTVLLQLEENDQVWIRLEKDSGVLNDYTTFSGFLLFEN